MINHSSKQKAAREYGIPRQTLNRHLKKLSINPEFGDEKRLGRRSVLTPEQDTESVDLILNMEARIYG